MPEIGVEPVTVQRPGDLSHDQLQDELERQAKLMTPVDQARLLKLVEALQARAAIDTGRLGALSPDELRDWADTLGRPAC
jgi:hypothetical protein